MHRDLTAQLQSAEYQFPYHHLPSRDFGRLRVGRVFRGGAEYLSYTEAVVDLVAAERARSVLDVGCGDGRLLFELSLRLPGTELSGVDTDERAARLASAFVPAADIRVQPVENVDERFDVVTCVETLEHLPDEDEGSFLAATAARVGSGGTLIVTVPSTALPVSAKHHRHYDVDSLAGVLRASAPELEMVALREIVVHRPLLDRVLPLLSNRHYSLDVGWLNERIAALHRRPVPDGRRGLHVIAVARRPADDD